MMPNIIDYLDWRGELSFDQVPFNDIDNLILSQLCYLEMNTIVPSFQETGGITFMDAGTKFLSLEKPPLDNIGAVRDEDLLTLLMKVHKSPRFKDMILSGYINDLDYELHQQFSATIYTIAPNLHYIAYRGTDSSLLGWRENFNMSYLSVTPSQSESLEYISKAAETLPGNFIVGGHSKGGNLAVYSSIHSPKELRDRIIKIYNNDGPGFSESISQKPEFIELENRLATIIPESSVVGLFLEHNNKYTIVKSAKKNMAQHDIFSWQLIGSRFIEAPGRTRYSQIADIALKQWLDNLDTDQRIEFVNTLFTVLEQTGMKNFSDINDNTFEGSVALIKALGTVDEEQRSLLLKVAGAFLFDSAKAMTSVLSIKKSPRKSRGQKYAIIKTKVPISMDKMRKNNNT